MIVIREKMKSLMPRRGDVDSHPGLLLLRYLHESAVGDQGKPEHKRQVMQAAISAAANSKVLDLYKLAFQRWKESLPKLTVGNDLQTVGRLIVGLGTENVLEAGIRLHHTYGLPILPGSALKGLAAHYCDQVWGKSNSQFRKATKEQDEAYRKWLDGGGPKPEDNYHRLLFGICDDGGCIVFHDALFVPDSEIRPLKPDVMTPHHPNWLDGAVPPTDFDSPNPVPFLSVAGKFHVAVSWRGPVSEQSEKWTELAFSLLAEALCNWGIGGKTTSGYGRLETPDQSVAKQAGAELSRPLEKRKSGTGAQVTIVGVRPKGGLDVQENGYKQGTLTIGTPPDGLDTSIGAIVDVLVHNDDPRKPQYRWPDIPKGRSK